MVYSCDMQSVLRDPRQISVMMYFARLLAGMAVYLYHFVYYLCINCIGILINVCYSLWEQVYVVYV